MLPKGMF